jgi:hypothetical protein
LISDPLILTPGKCDLLLVATFLRGIPLHGDSRIEVDDEVQLSYELVGLKGVAFMGLNYSTQFAATF